MPRQKLHSKWFKGNFYIFSSKKMKTYTEKYEKGVKKPTAVETKMINGKPHSRFYYKPLTPDENWD